MRQPESTFQGDAEITMSRDSPQTWQSSRPYNEYIQLYEQDPFSADIGVRANIHSGGGGRPSFARMDSVGGGVVAEIFWDPYSVGGRG